MRLQLTSQAVPDAAMIFYMAVIAHSLPEIVHILRMSPHAEDSRLVSCGLPGQNLAAVRTGDSSLAHHTPTRKSKA